MDGKDEKLNEQKQLINVRGGAHAGSRVLVDAVRVGPDSSEASSRGVEKCKNRTSSRPDFIALFAFSP